MAKNHSKTQTLDRDAIAALLPPGPEQTTIAEIIADFAIALAESWPTIGAQTLEATGQAPISFSAKITKGSPKMPFRFQIGMQPYVVKGEGYLPDPNQLELVPGEDPEEEEEEAPKAKVAKPAAEAPVAAPKRRGRPPKAKPAEVEEPAPTVKGKAEEPDESDFGEADDTSKPLKSAKPAKTTTPDEEEDDDAWN